MTPADQKFKDMWLKHWAKNILDHVDERSSVVVNRYQVVPYGQHEPGLYLFRSQEQTKLFRRDEAYEFLKKEMDWPTSICSILTPSNTTITLHGEAMFNMLKEGV